MQLLLGFLYVLIIGAVIVSMAVLLLMGKRENYNIMYLGCQGMVLLWCLSQILILLSGTQEELVVSYLLGNVGVCFLGAFWFGFARLYSRRKLPVWVSFMPFVLSGMHYLLILTNPWHHLYYTEFWGDKITYGCFFYTNVTETYVFVVTGAILLYRGMERKKAEERYLQTGTEADTAKHLIITAVLVPIALNLCYVSGLIHASFDVTPLGFGISGILVLLATFRYRFMEINMEAFDVVLSGLSDGVAIFDQAGECTFYNAAFVQYMGKENPYQAGKIQSQIMAMARVEMDLATGIGEDQVYRDAQGRYLQVQVYQNMAEVSLEEVLPDQSIVFVMKDISRYYALLRQSRELAVTSERLALERERNRIAGQVHDTAGHTLTMIRSYMKLALVAGEKQETAQVQQYLEEARELSSQGIRELRESINQLRRETDSELVTQGILQLADQVKEIPVEVTIQGSDSEQYSHLSRVLYDCVRETITNTLKYADANKLEIVVRFQESAVELMMADDGIGCAALKDHNGLAGIRERVNNAGGTVKFITGQQEGFLTRVRIPLEM
ncbi:MAG: hypothetical protein K2J67_03545 [Lachnospiraceae bacterium]|nr:hypothetical protein [Lachnospiraceae bacterium]